LIYDISCELGSVFVSKSTQELNTREQHCCGAQEEVASSAKQAQAKLIMMMEAVDKLGKFMYESATMEFNQERNLIA
jgi:hypothetical protein